MTDPQRACIACQTSVDALFCPQCGHPTDQPRFTWPLLLREFLGRLTFEKGFLLTLREMTIRPGHFMRRYLAGHRRGFSSPLAFFFITTAIAVVANSVFIGDMSRLMDTPEMRAQLSVLTDQQYQLYLSIMDKVSTNTSLVMLVLLFPYGILNRLFFMRTGINTVESLIFAFFVFGQAMVVSTLMYPLFFLFQNIGIMAIAVLLVYVLIAGFAGWTFYGRGVWNQFKLFASLLISYAAFSVGTGILGITYVIMMTR